MLWILILIAFLLVLLTIYYINEIEVEKIKETDTARKGLKIGIVSDWHNTGVPIQSKFLSKCLGKKHEVFIFAYNKYIRDDADWGFKKLVFTKMIRPWKIIDWIKKEGLCVIFFPDRLEDPEVLDWCKNNGVDTVMVINYETIKKEEFDIYRKYAILMCPVKCTYDLLKKHGFKNIRFVRWAADDETFTPAKAPFKSLIRFIHNAGYGGAQWRKNSLAVVEAFNAACKKNRNIILIVKSQRPINEYPKNMIDIINDNGMIRVVDKDLGANELIELYRSCHVSILPSKWEGIGIPFIESLCLGLPVITVDAPPMNEWVRNGFNGLRARVEKWEDRKDRQLLVKGALVNVNDLAKKILALSNIRSIERMGRNAVKASKGMKKRFTREVEELISSL
jgi:glycosyltransferase involved in cell wall biosynthesis